MRFIKAIEITKFRSIYKANISTPDITILSGKNNSGKSNVLKALNLFFHGNTSYDTEYLHDRDFNVAYTGKAGGRREIEVRLRFDGVGEGKLKDDFSISRTFSKGLSSLPNPMYESINPDTQKALDNNDGNVTREFTRFLNKLEYIYVPAVRDKAFVQEFFTLFERVIDGDAGRTFDAALESLNTVLEDRSKRLSSDFEGMLGLKTQAKLSTRPTDVLEAIRIDVETGMKVTKGAGEKVPLSIDLFSNGDGILMSYLPHFLAYVSRHQGSRRFIWGFEEPENSLEYPKVQMLAEKFTSEFSQTAQILLTTHSPAFIKIPPSEKIELYRVYAIPGEVKGTSQVVSTSELQRRLSLPGIEVGQRQILSKELGMTELASEVESHIREIQSREAELESQITDLSRPVVYSEGANYKYLTIAKDFFDPQGDYEFADGGGHSQLKKHYEMVRRAGTRHKVAIAWDPECEQYRSLEKTDFLLPIVLPKSKDNKRILKGIEACMPESEIMNSLDRFYSTRINEDGGEVSVLKKEEVLDFFCKNPERRNFAAFEAVIKNIADFFTR